MNTEFYKFLYQLRCENNESLRKMAINLEITPAYLSAMEVGRKPIPIKFLHIISDCYNLTESQKTELEYAINSTNSRVEIELTKMNEAQKDVSLIFSRKIRTADDDLIKKLKELLNESEN